jgi:hypothetical protein
MHQIQQVAATRLPRLMAQSCRTAGPDSRRRAHLTPGPAPGGRLESLNPPQAANSVGTAHRRGEAAPSNRPRRAAPLPPATAPGDCGCTGRMPAALRRRRRRDLSRFARIALCQCVERNAHETNAPSSLRPPPIRAGGATCEAAGRLSPKPIQTATPPPQSAEAGTASWKNCPRHSLVLLLCASF